MGCALFGALLFFPPVSLGSLVSLVSLVSRFPTQTQPVGCCMYGLQKKCIFGYLYIKTKAFKVHAGQEFPVPNPYFTSLFRRREPNPTFHFFPSR
ncbi:hypothetical protein BGZ61DRAFT_450023 [Ilyonectria robusta]|uniref:uncharacterized protein n=1 Tax=Ilyonectria robusta TaxID=1079257 RepID=UPI001E8DFC08|nr:uncharacterized protein BGZ61DRAFT_450023 [Ilyonectria robusta]KAH8706514.1 hypothetical protein BGZ61DRAFT_450023 [Ilyonectria robusta]